MKISIKFLMMVVIIMALAGGAYADRTWELLKETPSFGEIFDCLVDNNGVLWVSTWSNGVYSFDEESWKSYDSEDGFFAKETGDFTLAPDGTVWLITELGLYSYNGSAWKSHQYAVKMQLYALFRIKYTQIFADDTGAVWVGARLRFGKFSGGNWTIYGETDGLPDDVISAEALSADSNGNVCLSFLYPDPDPPDPNSIELFHATHVFDGISWKSTYIPDYMGKEKNYDVGFNTLARGPDGKIWGCHGEYIYCLNDTRWEKIFNKQFIDARALESGPSGTMWATSQNGVSLYDGEQWIEFSGADGLPDKVIFLADGVNGEMWAATEKEIARFTPDGTAVEKAEPLTFDLTGNFPNPFNSSTTISFTLPNESMTELAIYNIAGQKIRTLISNRLLRGQHNLVWDGRDEWENSVSSGIYFYRLSADDNVLSGRMMMMK